MRTGFEIGDLVRLKSGGVTMVVCSLPASGVGYVNSVSFLWMHEGELRTGSAPVETLELLNDPRASLLRTADGLTVHSEWTKT